MGRMNEMFSVTPPDTTNREGYDAYQRTHKEEYLQTLLCNTMTNTYYAEERQLLKEAYDQHRRMAQKDPEFMAKALVYARQNGLMRSQPVFGLAVLAQYRPDIMAKVFQKVINIPDDAFDFLTMSKSLRGSEGGRAIKRQLGIFLNERLSEYWAIKYNGRGNGYNLTDVVRLAHVKPKNAKQKALFRYLLGKATDADMEKLPQVMSYLALKNATTEDERISAIRHGRLPHEVVTGAIKPSVKEWEAILKEMPTFALLRNLNTMTRQQVFSDAANRDFVRERFTNADAISRSKIMPFQFLNAFDNVTENWLKDVLRESVELSVGALPDIQGRGAIFLDVSGSMMMGHSAMKGYLKIGSIFAFSMFKKTQGNTIFRLFNTRTVDAGASRFDSILSQASRITANGGTDCGSTIRSLMENNEVVDYIVMLTDEQQNTGYRSFYQELTEYRRRFNPNAKCFVIDMSPYRSAMVPPSDKNTFVVYGWSDHVLRFIQMNSQGMGTLVDIVESVSI